LTNFNIKISTLLVPLCHFLKFHNFGSTYARQPSQLRVPETPMIA